LLSRRLLGPPLPTLSDLLNQHRRSIDRLISSSFGNSPEGTYDST
jgi:hypothetical protein